MPNERDRPNRDREESEPEERARQERERERGEEEERRRDDPAEGGLAGDSDEDY
jgi:hypothetical protein